MLIQYWSICVSTSKAQKMHWCWLLLFMVLVKMCLGKTSIRTALTVEMKENEVVGSEVVDLNVIDAKKKMKISLLEVNAFEMKYFQLNSDEKKIFTRQVINREEFLDRRYCLNRLYCLIELHLLINDGEEYWIIPIHLIDENDHRPEFEKEEVRMSVGEDVADGYQMIVGGAKDLDEGENGEVRYLLDCSSERGEEKTKTRLMKKVQTMSNCVGMFELMFLSEMRSETMIGFDQLAIKITSQLSKRRPEDEEFRLTLLAMDQNAQGKQLSSEMKIRIEIKEKEKFIVVKKYFLVDRLDRHERRDLGDLIDEKNKTLDEEISYQLVNQTNDLHIDRVTGRVNIEHEEQWRFNSNEKRRTYLIQLTSTTTNKQWKKKTKKSLVQLQLFPRRLDQLNEIWLRPSSSSSSFVKNLSSIVINLNEVSFVSSIDFVIENDYYPDDEFVIENLNDKDLFRVEEKQRRETTTAAMKKKKRRNLFSLRFLRFSALKTNEIYRLNLRIKHSSTQQLLNNRIIDIQLRSFPFTPSSSSSSSNEMISSTSTSSLPSSSSSSSSWKGFECVKEKVYYLRDQHQRSFALITILETTPTVNISSSSSSSSSTSDVVLMQNEENRFLLDQCPIEVQFNFTADLSTSQLCSDAFSCFNITFTHQTLTKSFLSSLPWSSSMMVMLGYFFVGLIVLLSMIIVVLLLLCHLKSSSSCLRLKNYLFYGKKYQLSQMQRLSTSKINSRIHSIVIKESEPSPVLREDPQRNSSIFHIDQPSSNTSNHSTSSFDDHFDESRLASDV